jgi:hypothetical protein
MTFEQILWAINDAAEAAAESAVEAHGEEIPSAEMAWEFINEALRFGRDRTPGCFSSVPSPSIQDRLPPPLPHPAREGLARRVARFLVPQHPGQRTTARRLGCRGRNGPTWRRQAQGRGERPHLAASPRQPG